MCPRVHAAGQGGCCPHPPHPLLAPSSSCDPHPQSAPGRGNWDVGTTKYGVMEMGGHGDPGGHGGTWGRHWVHGGHGNRRNAGDVGDRRRGEVGPYVGHGGRRSGGGVGGTGQPHTAVSVPAWAHTCASRAPALCRRAPRFPQPCTHTCVRHACGAPPCPPLPRRGGGMRSWKKNWGGNACAQWGLCSVLQQWGPTTTPPSRHAPGAGGAHRRATLCKSV